MTFRKTVAGIIYQDNEFLLIRKPHWKKLVGDVEVVWWDLVQGGVEPGESLDECIVRELREETSSNNFELPIYTHVFNRRLFSEQTQKHYSDRGNIGKEISYYAVKYIGDRSEIRVGDDIVEAKWFNNKEAIDSIYEENRSYFVKAINFMRERKMII